MSEPHPLDDPSKKRRVVRLLAVLAPAMLVFCYVLAWLQGAQPAYAGLIGLAGCLLCLGAAAAIQIMGSKAWMALVALKIAALLVKR